MRTGAKIGVAMLVLLLTACSPMDLIKGAFSKGDGPSLEVETVVGDKEQAVVGSVGDKTEISTESFTGGVNTTNVQDIPPWVMILLILGWVLPSHREIGTWFKKRK